MKVISLSAFLIETRRLVESDFKFIAVKNFQLFGFQLFTFQLFLLPLQSFWAEGIGCGPKGLGNRIKTLKQTGVAHPDSYREVE